jgi:hypothetical protein
MSRILITTASVRKTVLVTRTLILDGGRRLGNWDKEEEGINQR